MKGIVPAVITSDSSFESLRLRLRSELLARMPDHVARLGWSREQIVSRQRAQLRLLLGYALERSPFHARRLTGIDPATIDVDGLRRLPSMTKDDLMDNFDDVVTDRRLDRGMVEAALARTGSQPVPILGDYLAIVSGGSSGRRGVFLLDPEAWVEFYASVFRPSFARMGRPSPGTRAALVGAPSPIHATGLAPAVMAGGPLELESVPASLPLAAIVDRLEAIKPQILLGYTTVLARLAKERSRGALDISPRAVTTTSEMLTPEARAAIEQGFEVPVFDSFGSSEGLVGGSTLGDSTLVFNSDVCIVELVDERNEPVPIGVPSNKVLVTNLANRLQPLIRYELSDRFVRQADDPHHGHMRALVEGRSDEILTWGRVALHPIVIRSALVRHAGAADYQVRQTDTGIELVVLADRELDDTVLSRELTSALADAGLHDPRVSVRITTELERVPGTGKLRRIIPLPG